MLKLTNIYVYPIKSLGGVELNQARAQERGLQYDRRWVLVNDEGVFLSQRMYPAMALLKVSILDEKLLVTSPDASSIKIELNHEKGEVIDVKIWDDKCQGYEMDKSVSRWFSKQLEVNCRLVHMGDKERFANPKFVRNKERVSYADGYQYLIVGHKSLEDLNNRMEASIPMNRFRPNLIFSGGLAFEEDSWGDFSIGEIGFYGIKPCSRCVMTTIDQETALKGKEPLKTLLSFRQKDNKVYFGTNASVKLEGLIKVGDLIIVHEKK